MLVIEQNTIIGSRNEKYLLNKNKNTMTNNNNLRLFNPPNINTVFTDKGMCRHQYWCQLMKCILCFVCSVVCAFVCIYP